MDLFLLANGSKKEEIINGFLIGELIGTSNKKDFNYSINLNGLIPKATFILATALVVPPTPLGKKR